MRQEVDARTVAQPLVQKQAQAKRHDFHGVTGNAQADQPAHVVPKAG